MGRFTRNFLKFLVAFFLAAAPFSASAEENRIAGRAVVPVEPLTLKDAYVPPVWHPELFAGLAGERIEALSRFLGMSPVLLAELMDESQSSRCLAANPVPGPVTAGDKVGIVQWRSIVIGSGETAVNIRGLSEGTILAFPSLTIRF